MSMNGPSKRMSDILQIMAPVVDFITNSEWSRRLGEPGLSDFMVGNPQEWPLPEFTAALKKWAEPQNKDWFAYKENEPASRAIIAESLQRQRGVAFEPNDIFMTTCLFSALSVSIAAVTDPGDEVIFVSPPWFFYEAIIAAAGDVPVRVRCNRETFDLDLKAIEAVITPRTRAIIISSPNNPTGRIYPPETLERLASLLEAASQRNGRAIYILSDEAYSHILYDGNHYPSPTGYYPNSLLLYTYGKTLLTPGQRIGYIALPPVMQGRDDLRPAIFASQLVNGFAFPNALLQHALPDIDVLSIDIAHLQAKRDRMVPESRKMGYDLQTPEGTFYLLVKSPLAVDMAFCDLLAKHDVFCLPGAVFEMPGYFRISLTASDEMIERALPGFAAAIGAQKEAVRD